LPTGALPNFIVVGVSRAGTTTLFNALAAHPQVCASSTKETRYFQAVRYGEPLAPLSDYQAYFRRFSGEPVVMECTPDYFYGGAATAQAIKATCDPRVTIILREPISRLISFYRFMGSRLQLPRDMTLTSYVTRCLAVPEANMNRRDTNVYTGLWGGQYARHLPAWLETYGDRLDIVFFDDLAADPAALLARLCRRLGIDPTEAQPATDPENPSAGYRSPTAQRAAAFAAKRSRAVFRRFPALYATSRRLYEAVNQQQSAETPVAATALREISAVYQPWNELLGQQLRDAGHSQLPEWLSQ
jgi:Sulfotransferase domain